MMKCSMQSASEVCETLVCFSNPVFTKVDRKWLDSIVQTNLNKALG